MAWWIADGILQRADSAPTEDSILTDITGTGNAVVPEGVTGIGEEAFCQCDKLTGVALPEGVTFIGRHAFSECVSLNRITLPDGLMHIGEGAFAWCWSLGAIRVPESVEEIGERAFCGCGAVALPAALWSALDKDSVKQLKIISCPISLKEVPWSARLKMCIGFALTEGRYSKELREEYIRHIRQHAALLAKAAFEHPKLLRLMCSEKLIPAKDVDKFTEEATRRRKTELTAMILDYQANIITMKEVSKARERREKLRERQDEVIIGRMEARMDKVGIRGLNFVVTGALKHFERRKDAGVFIAERGGRLLSAMSANADYLITNDTSTGSNKNRRAAELGIAIITEKEFMKMAEEA